MDSASPAARSWRAQKLNFFCVFGFTVPPPVCGKKLLSSFMAVAIARTRLAKRENDDQRDDGRERDHPDHGQSLRRRARPTFWRMVRLLVARQRRITPIVNARRSAKTARAGFVRKMTGARRSGVETRIGFHADTVAPRSRGAYCAVRDAAMRTAHTRYSAVGGPHARDARLVLSGHDGIGGRTLSIGWTRDPGA